MVIDASVAVKWFLDEAGSREARTLLEDGRPLIAPSCLFLEVTHVIWGAVRRGRTTPDALRDVPGLLSRIFPEPVPDLSVLADAAELMRRHDHPVYDCVYLALAARSAAPLVTADEGQFAAARQARIEARRL